MPSKLANIDTQTTLSSTASDAEDTLDR